MYNAGDLEPLAATASVSEQKSINSATSRRAIEILLKDHVGFCSPTKAQRQNLLVAYATRGFALPGAAYDIIRLTSEFSLEDPAKIAEHLDAITLYEVKSTNRGSVREDLKGYFFNITAAELLTAQALGERFKFGFVNVLTGSLISLSLSEVMAKSRSFYPAWHIKF